MRKKMTYNEDGKRKVKCVDGPFKGEKLWLSDGLDPPMASNAQGCPILWFFALFLKG